MKCKNPDCKYHEGDNELFPKVKLIESGVKEGKQFYKYSCADCGTEWIDTEEFKESPKTLVDKVEGGLGSKHKKMLDYTFPTGDGWL